MGNRTGRQLSLVEAERRRLQAADLFEQGMRPSKDAELEVLLRAGPMEHGWEDQRWTLARIGRLIEERFHVTYEVSGVWRLLDRLGWSWQVPKVRAVERNEEAIAAWYTETWPAASPLRRAQPPAGGVAF